MQRLAKACLFFLSLITFFFSFTAFAWGPIGHMVIANIAYQRLTPDAREKVDGLVAKLSTEYPDMNSSFLHMSCWPDMIRAQKIETYMHWHYINIPFTKDDSNLPNTIDTDNAVWAVNKIEEVVQNDHANPYERARFLAFLTHVVEDLHQPLHTTTYVSAEYPNGDKGGNLYHVSYDGKRTNLHHLWDSGVGVFEGENSPEHINQLAESITSLYPERYFGTKVDDLDPEHWSREGWNQAKEYVYSTPENNSVSDDYIQAGQKISEQNAALAGYRLAHLLNQLLG